MAPLRLLNTSSYKVKLYTKLLQDEHDVGAVPYAILSHRWLDDDQEITYKDMPAFEGLMRDQTSRKRNSVEKVLGFCRIAKQQGFQYVWLDTVCIDQTNPVELQTSINSMYRWYQGADICYAYLFDYDPLAKPSDPMGSAWFDRGWTLQELVAPTEVYFFDRRWKPIGSKRTQRDVKSKSNFIDQDKLWNKTGIDPSILTHKTSVSSKSIAHRMSWFKGRTTGVPEDSAYCLMGLFSVNIPLLYGEGLERAFRRLQEQIMRDSDDHSLFAWTERTSSKSIRGLLAPSPSCFENSGNYYHLLNHHNNAPYAMTNKGLHIDLYIMKYLDKGEENYIATLDCPEDSEHYLSIWLKRESPDIHQYCRIRVDQPVRVPKLGRGNLTRIFVRQPIET